LVISVLALETYSYFIKELPLVPRLLRRDFEHFYSGPSDPSNLRFTAFTIVQAAAVAGVTATPIPDGGNDIPALPSGGFYKFGGASRGFQHVPAAAAADTQRTNSIKAEARH